MHTEELHPRRNGITAPAVWVERTADSAMAIRVNAEVIRIVEATLPNDMLMDEDEALSEIMAAGHETTIPLGKLNRVSGDARHLKVEVAYESGSVMRYLTNNHLATATITFSDPIRRDEFFRVMTERLGPPWTFSRRAYTRMGAAVGPLGIVVLIAALTWLFHWGAVDPAEARRTGGSLKSILGRRLVGLLGPKGVLVAGAVALIATLVWGARRVENPPIRLLLKRPVFGGRGRSKQA